MVHSPPAHATTTTRHGVATVTMSYEKQQNGIPKRLPVPNINTQSPKWAGRVNSLPKLAGTTATNGHSARRREGTCDGSGVEESFAEDGGATPIKPLLSSNITPRSGSRKARAETTSPTPNGIQNATRIATPSKPRRGSSVERHDTAMEDARTTSGLGLRVTNAGRRSRTGSVNSDGPSSSVSSRQLLMERNNSATRVTSPEITSKFFHADDIKVSIPSGPTPERALSQGRSPGCAQSKDENVPLVRTSSFSSSPISDEQRPKFFYANDVNESKTPLTRLTNGNQSSRPPLQTIYSAHGGNSPERAPSPLKEEILPQIPLVYKASPRRHTRLVSNGSSELTSPQGIQSGNANLARRSSLSSPKSTYTTPHARSSSVNSAGPSPPRRSSVNLSEKSPIERIRTTSFVEANGPLHHSVSSRATTPEPPQPHVFSQPQSPIKPAAGGQSKIDQMNELAANARRERKVLDLEISNSSLLAINRTLEREMRKQTAELRRFRRLSRSGRLSVAPSRSASGKMSMLLEATDEPGQDLSDSDDDLEDLLSSLSSMSATSHPSSPAAHARFGDPERVELDLASHRALLLDSQKLNVSIKRCLSTSESLLAAAKEALAHHEEPLQLEKLGPRVLTPDDVGDEMLGRGQGLLSPSLNHGMNNPWERSLGSIESLVQGIPGEELETLDYSHLDLPRNIPRSLPDVTECHSPVLPDELTTDQTTATHITDMKLKLKDRPLEPNTQEIDRDAAPGKPFTAQAPNNKYAALQLEKPLPIPNLEPRRATSFLSLDGLDDDETIAAPPAKPTIVERIPSVSSEDLHPDSYAARSERNKMKSPDPKPGEAGFRGSMQGLGHYLQAFSMFGRPQQA
ncbi:hypothetical protein N7G274_008940 [Stereocaulon virgatum]|uniref:Uncharacterized protein n=1 Tax=Stereocaulon virgatum TaxID=373712 RepID=A0ABR3ZZ63_9LECA